MPKRHDGLTIFVAGAGIFGSDGNKDNIRIPAVTGNGPKSEANMDFIVATANALPDLLDEVERLTAELAALRERTRWIPVSERLPQGGEVVMFYDAVSNVVRHGWHASGILQWSSVADLYFHSEQYKWITHWMPLPGHPK